MPEAFGLIGNAGSSPAGAAPQTDQTGQSSNEGEEIHMTCIVIPADGHPYISPTHVAPDAVSDLIRGIPGGYAFPDMGLILFARENQEDLQENPSNIVGSVFASTAAGRIVHLGGTVVLAGNQKTLEARLLGAIFQGVMPECLGEEESQALMEILTEMQKALHGEATSAVVEEHGLTGEEFSTKIRRTADRALSEPREELYPVTVQSAHLN